MLQMFTKLQSVAHLHKCNVMKCGVGGAHHNEKLRRIRSRVL